jgi:nucleoid DNA-binding protein
MTLTKSHLIDAIVEQNGFTKKKSTETVETILEIIKSTLAVSRRNGISVIN